MRDKSEKKFYWVEGVSRDEVVRSLSDTQPSIFRSQKNRRILILLIAFLMVVSGLTLFMPQPKVSSYLEIITLASVLILYFKLRASVRHVADAPNELLDERLIAIRNAGYLDAYRYMTGITAAYVGIYFLINHGIIQTGLPLSEIKFSGSIVSYFMWQTCLPSMVVGWKMPTEEAN